MTGYLRKLSTFPIPTDKTTIRAPSLKLKSYTRQYFYYYFKLNVFQIKNSIHQSNILAKGLCRQVGMHDSVYTPI